MSLNRWLGLWTNRRRSHPRVDTTGAAQPGPARPPATAPNGGAPAAAPLPASAAPPRACAPEESRAQQAEEEAPAARRFRFFCWMLGAVPNAARPPAHGALIGEMLGRVDEIIASESLRAGLLPRAPHVIPQLMKTLRDEGYSAADVASRISRDAVLTAEVVRSATGILQRGEDAGDDEIDLGRAVAVVGTQGLRRAIANVVLRPIFDTRGSSLSARAAAQIWKDADRKARLCSALAGQAGLDAFDGYLAGLLHNSGWTAVLRAIDNLEDLSIGVADVSHPEVVPHVLRRRDTLFGALVGPWKLGAAIDGLAEEVARVGLDAVQSPLGAALRDADRLAALRALAPAGSRPAATVPGWSSLGQPVQDAYSGLPA
jgi:HD-like signal output (HDOD) protein